MLNPRVRIRRLRAEYERLRELHDSGGLVSIEETVGDPPDRYKILFTCRGIAAIVDDQPVYSDLHRVQIVLTNDFPAVQPLLEWLTPIFHPNISENGQVCIGGWYPAKMLDQLILSLGNMIQYKNYAVHDPLRHDASQWAIAHKEQLPVDKRSLFGPGQVTETETGISQQSEAGEIGKEITIIS